MAGATEDELWRRGDGGCGCSRRLSCMLLYGDGRTYMHTDLGYACATLTTFVRPPNEID